MMNKTYFQELIATTISDTQYYLANTNNDIATERLIANLKIINQMQINYREQALLFYKNNIETINNLYSHANSMLYNAIERRDVLLAEIACDYISQVRMLCPFLKK